MPRRTQTGKQELGCWGEEQATQYLQQNGYEIIARNVRTPYGEIDVVARKDERMVFVEVKTRSTASFGFPEEAVTEEKIIHMIESAQSYLQEHADLNVVWQIDVIAVQKSSDVKDPVITHFENAVS